MSYQKNNDHKIIRKCRICGKPTYHDVCASCKSITDSDEKQRHHRKPYWTPNREFPKKIYRSSRRRNDVILMRS